MCCGKFYSGVTAAHFHAVKLGNCVANITIHDGTCECEMWKPGFLAFHFILKQRNVGRAVPQIFASKSGSMELWREDGTEHRYTCGLSFVSLRFSNMVLLITCT